MNEQKVHDSILTLEQKRDEIWKSLSEKQNTKNMDVAFQKFSSTVRIIPWDWRFNSIVVAYDVYGSLRELGFAYSSMIAAHELYVSNVKPIDSPRHIGFLSNYYAGDVLFRLNSLWDKILLSYACYFFYHNPEERQDSKNLVKEVQSVARSHAKHPLQKNIPNFLPTAQSEDWKFLMGLRHSKAHRLDPQIDAYEVKHFHDLVIYKMISENEARSRSIHDFETGYDSATKSSLSPNHREANIEFYMSKRLIGDYYFEREQPSKRMTTAAKAHGCFDNVINQLIDCVTDLFSGLAKTDLLTKL